STVGAALLRDYALHIEPTQTNNDIHRPDSNPRAPGCAALPAETAEPIKEEPGVRPLPPRSTLRPFRQKSLRNKKALSTDCIPRQTIMKALASRSSLANNNNQNAPLAGPWTGLMPNSSSSQISPPAEERDRERRCSNTSSQLSAALSNLQVNGYLERSPATARLMLQSPCYFHQRFDGAVNIEKVLEEIADDEWLSHSRLVQTATGVREVSKQLQRRPIKRAVRNVMIVTKARDNSLVHLTREVTEWLLSTPRYGSELGVNVYVDAKLRNSKRFDAAGLLQKDPRFTQMLQFWTPDLCWTSPDKFDLVLTLGGDGTVLFTSWLFQRVVPPVLCFSLGSLGFLTNFEFADYQSQLNAVMGEVGMRVNLRMRFTCTVFRKDRSKGAEAGAVEEGEQFEVLNELVIDRGPSPYVSNLELYADNELLTVVQADGCIFSTPTGRFNRLFPVRWGFSNPPPQFRASSSPRSALTPSLSGPWSSPTRISSESPFPTHPGRVELRQGDYVTIEASQYPFPTVVADSGEWFTSVQRALRWNTRGAIQKSWDGRPDGDAVFEDEEWDIDTDAGLTGTDSGIGPSEDGDALSPNPMRRQMSLLNM
ncbi:hypothetical protein N7510_000751, partial [Penicillium lagena]|uniref:uncharacterized protein n=1 Tax=Penicillium lagena TaxID=94218 RepID=UPI0025400DC9